MDELLVAFIDTGMHDTASKTDEVKEVTGLDFFTKPARACEFAHQNLLLGIARQTQA